MFHYRDHSQLMVATENTWAGTTQAFKPMPNIQESLNPVFRTINAKSLNQNDRAIPLTVAEDMIAGDIEFLITPQNIAFWLPHIFHNDPTGTDVSYQNMTTDAEGRLFLRSQNLAPFAGEFIYSHAPNMPELDGWRASEGGHNGYEAVISGLKKNTRIANDARTYSRRHSPPNKTVPDKAAPNKSRSLALLKRLSRSEDWIKITGAMLQRLTIDLSEGQFLTATAALVAKNAGDYSQTPPQHTSTDVSAPISFAHGISGFYLRASDQSSDKITQDNSIITGLRLVLERQGMQPQFGLGDVFPRIILPGVLVAYGSFELLIADHGLLSFMTQHQHLRIGLAFDDAQGNGVAFTMHNAILTDVDVTGQGDAPLRAEFQFNATALGAVPNIAAFTALKS